MPGAVLLPAAKRKNPLSCVPKPRNIRGFACFARFGHGRCAAILPAGKPRRTRAEGTTFGIFPGKARKNPYFCSRNERRTPHTPASRRRTAHAPQGMGHPGRGVRRVALGDRRHDRQRRPAHHRAGIGHFVGRLDLDRQCLSAGHHGFAALVLGAGRRGRLPQNLHRRADALHGGFGGLRTLGIAPDPRAGARHAGIRSRGHHLGQHHADPLHLPQSPAGPRYGHQRHGGRRVVGGRADTGRRNPLRSQLAVAVRREHPDGARCPGAQPEVPAGKSRPGERTPVRLARRGDERPDVRPADGLGRRLLARAGPAPAHAGRRSAVSHRILLHPQPAARALSHPAVRRCRC